MSAKKRSKSTKDAAANSGCAPSAGSLARGPMITAAAHWEEVDELNERLRSISTLHKTKCDEVKELQIRLIERTQAYEAKDVKQLDRIRQLEAALRAYDRALYQQIMVPADVLPAWNAGNALVYGPENAPTVPTAD